MLASQTIIQTRMHLGTTTIHKTSFYKSIVYRSASSAVMSSLRDRITSVHGALEDAEVPEPSTGMVTQHTRCHMRPPCMHCMCSTPSVTTPGAGTPFCSVVEAKKPLDSEMSPDTKLHRHSPVQHLYIFAGVGKNDMPYNSHCMHLLFSWHRAGEALQTMYWYQHLQQ